MPASDRYPYAELIYRIIGAFYEVYNALGSGFWKLVYERALLAELRERGLSAERQVPVEVRFKGRRVGAFRPDLIVENAVLLELKARPALTPAHTLQTVNALRATGLEIGLLLNFGPRPQIKRVIASKRHT